MSWDSERYYNDPEYRERILEQGRKCYRKRAKTEQYKERINSYQRRRRREDPDYKERTKQYARTYRTRKRIEALVRAAKIRSRTNGLQHDDTFLNELSKERPVHCPVCSTEFDYSYGGKIGPKNNGPSLDRIDCTRGYVAGNVEIICWRCNAIKREATFEELERIVEYMRKKRG